MPNYGDDVELPFDPFVSRDISKELRIPDKTSATSVPRGRLDQPTYHINLSMSTIAITLRVAPSDAGFAVYVSQL